MPRLLILPLLLFIFATTAIADSTTLPTTTQRAGLFADPRLQRMTWKVGDVAREALVYLPPKSDKPAPLIFAFHGHGGTSRFAARHFNCHELWPEAIVVYPQGLLTPSPLVDPEGKLPGWQKAVGDQDDRDLKFFDTMLKSIKAEHNVDASRIYVTGHSNGGYFTYLLLGARGDIFAAVAPVAAAFTLRDARNFKPKPILHVAGEKDPLVKFEMQKRAMDFDRKLDHCDPEGKPDGEFCTRYSSKDGPPVITYIHPAGHEIPPGAPKRIIEFFKEQTLKAPAPEKH